VREERKSPWGKNTVAGVHVNQRGGVQKREKRGKKNLAVPSGGKKEKCKKKKKLGAPKEMGKLPKYDHCAEGKNSFPT